MANIDIAQETTLDSALEKAQNLEKGVSYTTTIMGNGSSSKKTVTGKGVAIFSGMQQSTTVNVKIDDATEFVEAGNMFGATIELSFNKSIQFYGNVAYVIQTV